jgi:hypothetical protein
MKAVAALPRAATLALTVALWVAAAPARAEGALDRFIDPDDGKFDMSEWLLDHKGFLPVPIIITEPAVGYGGGVAAVFFSESLRDAAAKAGSSGHITPPDVYAIGAAATQNGTRVGAAGGQWTFLDDRYRYRGGVGETKINLDFYGVGGQFPIPIEKVGYTLEGFASFQQGMVRLGDGDTFLGARWIYLDLKTSLDIDAGRIGLTPRQLAKRNSGLGLVLEHDSRDNIFTPNKGLLGAAEATFYSRDLGGDNNFQAYRGHVFGYLPLQDRLTLGLRADARLARGDVPFYMLPFIDLRGVPAARFQDTNVGVLEAEARYDLDARWAAIGFLGTGRAWGERTTFSAADKPVAGGVGFRYLIARRLGLYAGMDFAWSTVDKAFYIQVGNAWR